MPQGQPPASSGVSHMLPPTVQSDPPPPLATMPPSVAAHTRGAVLTPSQQQLVAPLGSGGHAAAAAAAAAAAVAAAAAAAALPVAGMPQMLLPRPVAVAPATLAGMPTPSLRSAAVHGDSTDGFYHHQLPPTGSRGL